MPKFISDDEMAAIDSSRSKKFISDDEMASIDHEVSSPHSQGLLDKVKNTALGLGQGSTMGFGDEAAGVVGAAIDSILSDESKPFVDRYREARDYARGLNSKAQSENPVLYGAGEIAGGIASSAPFGASAGTVKGATALGGAYGLGGSDADLTRGDVGQAAMDTAKGAAIGGGTAAAMKYFPKIAKILGGKLKEGSEETALKALGGNKAAFQDQIKRGTNLGRNALDEGIIGPFSGTEKMLERSQLLKQRGGNVMDEAFRQADEVGKAFNPWDVATDFYKSNGEFYKSPINRDLTNQLENTIETMRMRGNQPISLREAQGLKDELSRVGYPKGKAPLAPSDKQLLAQDAVRSVKEGITSAADSLLGEEGKQLLQQGRRQYGTGKGAEQLLTGKLAAEQSKGGFSMSDLIYKPVAAVTSPQLRAWTGDKVSKILQTSPQSFGKFAPVLQNAMQRGPAAVNAAVHVLSTDGGQKGQEFRAIQRQLNGQESPEGR